MIIYHVLYWVTFTAFFSVVWGTYDDQYGNNLMVQLLSLPSRLVLTYGILLVLIPKFLEREKYAQFAMGLLLLLLFSGIAIQRSVMVYIVEGVYVPFNSKSFFRVSEIVNTVIDVGIACVIPFSIRLFSIWRSSRLKIRELMDLNKVLTNPRNEDFIVIPANQVNHKVLFSDIFYIESNRNYLNIKTKSSELTTYGSISAMCDLLPTEIFCRIHRSFIVNTDHVESFSSRIVKVAGVSIPIGRKYKKLVVDELASRFRNEALS